MTAPEVLVEAHDKAVVMAALSHYGEACRAAGYETGYARAVADTAAQITASTGHTAGTPEEVIRWLVRTWDAPKLGFCKACETRDGCIKRGCKINGVTP